jgi:hypothetical protein
VAGKGDVEIGGASHGYGGRGGRSAGGGGCGSQGGRGGGDFYGRPQHNRGWGGRYDRDRQEDGDYRRPKLNFPSFNGESDPLPWLNKCETYFRGMRTMAEEKVWIASLHLKGVAADWYYALERDHAIPSWARFAEFVNMRFGPPLRTNSLAELKDLRRTGSVEEYQRQFSVLLCRCDDLSPSQQVNMFTAGLGEPLRTDVEMQTPTTLQYAMSLARAYERRTVLPTDAALSKPSHSNPRSSTAATTVVTVIPPKSVAPAKPRFKRLTMEEMAAKRANGECYYCPEKYTGDHKCPVKGVFLLELDDDVAEEEAVEELGISLHALTGIDVGEAMKL